MGSTFVSYALTWFRVPVLVVGTRLLVGTAVDPMNILVTTSRVNLEVC